MRKEVFLKIILIWTLPDVLQNENENFNKICLIDYVLHLLYCSANNATLSICECFNRLIGFTRDLHIITAVSQPNLHVKILERNNDTTCSDTLA